MIKKRKRHHDEHMDETWLIPYADLLTLLLALFIILFAVSQVDQKKYDHIMRSLNTAFSGGTNFFQISSTVPMLKEPKDETKKNDETSEQQVVQNQMKQESKDLEELKKQLDKYIQNNNLSTQLETKLTNDFLMITIRDHALYASGSANIKPESQKLAIAISEMLAQYPNYQIEVAGHTDNVPIHNAEFQSNWDLSYKRGLNFMEILLQNSKINPSRFRSIAYGEYRPIYTNDTAEGRGKNRRVEVSIIKNIKEPEVKIVNP